MRHLQNANECKSLFSSAILTQCLAYQSPYPHFSLEIVTTPHDDLSFQQEWFRKLAEKKTDAKWQRLFFS